MTVNQLYKRLGKLIECGYGIVTVSVAKETFKDNRENDGCTILQLEGLGVRRINLADDDGGTKINKDGSEASKLVCMLVGSSGATAKGDLVDL